jgi:hypothetical protein
MHLVNILRIITLSFLVGHSILTISDFNSFRFFWDTLYCTKINKRMLNIFLYIQSERYLQLFSFTQAQANSESALGFVKRVLLEKLALNKFLFRRVYFKKRLELHILGMLRSITCLTGGSKNV